ncbi:MAG TPA: DM13 domain-containing protein [Gemmatimonadales bacterium]
MSSPRTFFTTLAALACLAAPAAAQQDTGMMAHDTAMMDHGESMDHGTAMDDKMGDDKMMDHDSTGGTAMHGGRMFMGASGEKAAGDYEVIEADGKRQLKLDEEFAVADGRDLYLALANGNAADESSLFLGKLKQRTGAQAYDLPNGKDLSGYTTLLVWSKKDRRALARADWHAGDGGSMEHM